MATQASTRPSDSGHSPLHYIPARLDFVRFQEAFYDTQGRKGIIYNTEVVIPLLFIDHFARKSFVSKQAVDLQFYLNKFTGSACLPIVVLHGCHVSIINNKIELIFFFLVVGVGKTYEYIFRLDLCYTRSSVVS